MCAAVSRFILSAGHSDVLMGSVAVNDPKLAEEFRNFQRCEYVY